MQSYLTVGDYATAELTEKRSRFIAHVFHVETEEQAAECIARVRKKYWDARHNVYAYILREGNIKKYSDDSEPHGTAGPPVLDALQGAGLCDTLVVVTRYFGGILLGTGGLVRAYGDSAALGIAAAQVKEMQLHTVFETTVDYSDYGRLQTVIAGFGGSVEKADFADSVRVIFSVKNESVAAFYKKCEEIFKSGIKFDEKSVKYC